jgi:hypothetical protein
MAFALPLAAAGIGALGSWLGSRKSSQNNTKFKSLDLFSPQQKGFQNNILQQLGNVFPQGLGYLQSLFNPDGEGFDEFEAPLLRQFNEQTIPGLAERFAGLGATSSSGFQQALAQAGTGLAEKLGAQRGALRQGALSNLLGFGQLGLQTGRQNVEIPGQMSGMQSFGQGLAPLAGMGVQGLFQYQQQNQLMKQLPQIMAAINGKGG